MGFRQPVCGWKCGYPSPEPAARVLIVAVVEQSASAQKLEDAEDKAALADWRAREAAGQISYVPHEEALQRPLTIADAGERPRTAPSRSGDVDTLVIRRRAKLRTVRPTS